MLRALAETMRAAGRRRDAGSRGCCTAAAWPATCSSEGELRPAARGGGGAAAAATAVPAIRRPTAAPRTSRWSTARATRRAFTASNGSHSGVVVPGAGLHLNNMMGEEDLAAGRQLRPGQAADEHAGAELRTGGEVRLVVGSSGSNRLRSAITQVIVNVLDHGMAIARRCLPPRPRRGRPAGLRGRLRPASSSGSSAGASGSSGSAG